MSRWETAKFQRCVTTELPRESVKLRGIEEIEDWTGIKSFYRREIKSHEAFARFVDATKYYLIGERLNTCFKITPPRYVCKGKPPLSTECYFLSAQLRGRL